MLIVNSYAISLQYMGSIGQVPDHQVWTLISRRSDHTSTLLLLCLCQVFYCTIIIIVIIIIIIIIIALQYKYWR